MANFTKSNFSATPKWLLKNEEKVRFDLSIQRGFVWDIERKSLFINSLIETYPVPAFYAQDNSNDDYIWMLDGKQRFGTVLSYLKNEFSLSPNTPSVNNVEIANLRFSELPQDFQDEIKDYSFNIWKFKNISESERDQIFYRLNEGMSLSKMELTRVLASSKIMDFINEISKHEFFQNVIAISDNQRNRFIDQEIILQILSVLINGYTKGFSSKELQEFALKLKENGIPDNIKEVIKNTTDYIYQAIPVKEKFMKKVNIPIIFNVAVKAQNNEVTSEKFGGFLQMFFNDIPTEYDYATDSGSAKKENVKIRIDEMNRYFDENINSASNYKLPEPKTTGKRGRPLGSTKEKLIQSNPPENPLPLVASPESLS